MIKKILLLTDIHGNLPALEAILKEVKNIHFEAIICNGDIIYGASPNQCLEKMIELKAFMIAGNVESNVIRLGSKLLPDYWYGCEQFEFTRHIAKILTEKNYLYLFKLSEQLVIEGLLPGKIRMVHGSPDDQYEWISPLKQDGRFEEIMTTIEEDIIIFGHTHKQWHQKYNGKIAINAGSVGLPLDGEPNAQYTIIQYQDDDFDSIEIVEKSVIYDNQRAYQDFIEAGFEAENPSIKLHKELLRTGIKREIPFVDFYFDLIKEKMGKNMDEISIEECNQYWRLADQIYDWKE